MNTNGYQVGDKIKYDDGDIVDFGVVTRFEERYGIVRVWAEWEGAGGNSGKIA